MPAHEYPVTDAVMDAIADEALGPEPDLELDPLDGDFSDAPGDEGRAKDDRELQRRQRLLLRAPSVRDVLSSRRKKAFLKALAATGNISSAAASAGWSRGIPTSLRKADKEFAQGWEVALEAYVSVLEAAAHRRAVVGVTKGVYGSMGKDQGTGLIGTEVVYSDSLLQTLLKANNRAKYGDKQELDVTSKGGVLHVPVAPSDWERLAGAGQQKFREQREED